MTAIQAAQHEQFCKAIDSLTLSYEAASLATEKIMIENLYLEYREKIREVQQLIAEYKKIQVKTRKKMASYQRDMQRPLRNNITVSS